MSHDSPFRRLPSVHAVVDQPELVAWINRAGRNAVVDSARTVLAATRAELSRGEDPAVDLALLAAQTAAILASAACPVLRPVLNATGILINTGLGRAPLAQVAVKAVAEVAAGYSNLEYDLDGGDRGDRLVGVEPLLCRLTGAERAVVVNNNAAATIIAVRALAEGREVIVSRGQLVEIGGSFRLPEIIAVSGAKLVEVGTTNKTRLSDYERAIGPNTAAILRVHPSNYRVVGFTEEVEIKPLVDLAHARGLWAIDDIGSGVLRAGWSPSVSAEPTAAAGISAAADLVLFSGDKLLGGPQAGILVGSTIAIETVRREPLMRALRVDKLTLAALEATLRLHLDFDRHRAEIPVWALHDIPTSQVRDRAETLANTLRSELRLDAHAEPATAYFGGGTTPTAAIESAAVRVVAPIGPARRTERDWARTLRLGSPAVVPRVAAGAVWFDLRSLPGSDDLVLLAAIRRSLEPQ